MEAVKETGINGLEPLTNRSASVQKGIEKEKELFFRIFTCKNDNMKKYLDLKLDLGAMLIIQIEKDIVHWHGAAPDSCFSHLAIEVPGENSSNEWTEPVSDEDYGKLK